MDLFLSIDIHRSTVNMLVLLLIFATIHSGGAALRSKAEVRIGPRMWRLLFATLSVSSASIVIGYFLPHYHDGVCLWNLQESPISIVIAWIVTAISFVFLYPATYNLLEIPAILMPRIRLYGNGIIRVTRHPQAIGQILWCLAHMIWIGSSFMLFTCIALVGYHIFATWHGDRRLMRDFGNAFAILKANTSIIPFLAVFEGRQQFVFEEFLRPAQLGIITTIGLFWWSHRFISTGSIAFLGSRFEGLLTWPVYSSTTSTFAG
uniref:NnrU domain-containing protein n=1 Tax=Paulinella micropora TaxID=1928728 RepID=A0A385I009_9EUKA|nr:hypothetical protein PMNZ_316 [Paulinella micropora]AXY63260.1 hypothetical protein PMNZ_316 [Paulinella micropora]